MCAVRLVTITVAWLCATAAAVGVAWFGVHTVMQDTAMPLPQLAVPPGSVTAGVPPPLTGLAAPTTVPTPTATQAPSTSTQKSSTKSSPPTTSPAAQNTGNSAGDVQRYSTKGGEVILDLTSTSATLVSATPAEGYAVQTWQETDWLRVDFNSGNQTSTVIAAWNGHPPTVQSYDS
jgi:hypothetical protein